MNRNFRRYHRAIAMIVSLPLLLTVLSGMGYTLIATWLGQASPVTGMLLGLHTGRIVHLEAVYPMLNGLGLLGLIVTGVSMTGWFRKRKQPDGQMGDR